jgi:hypothetical protein
MPWSSGQGRSAGGGGRWKHTRSGSLETAKVVEPSQLADYTVPRYVVLSRKGLLRLPSGKISEAAIRVEYQAVRRCAGPFGAMLRGIG